MAEVTCVALHSIELCAGVGMLGEGVRAGFELLGIEHRTVCYVEREAPAAAQIAALMEAGALDSAPISSDLLTFDGAAWRGCVDFLVAGFPCQDISIAGRRARWPAPGSGLGVNAGREPEQGCGHVDDAQRVEQPGKRIHARSRDTGAGAADADRAGAALADTEGDGWNEGGAESGRQQGRLDAAQRGSAVAYANGDGCGAKRIAEGPNGDVGQSQQAMADTSQPGLPHAEQPGQPGQPQPLGRRAVAELRGTPLFAPGPIDPRWPAVVAYRPDLAPAVEPGVRLLADRMAYLVDESRAHQLRQGGNGVVPLQAAVALVELVRRAANLK